jgi:hypothetical protein
MASGQQQMSSSAWWVQGGAEHCQFCGRGYDRQVESRCFHCDRRICPFCVIIVRDTWRTVCPECRDRELRPPTSENRGAANIEVEEEEE